MDNRGYPVCGKCYNKYSEELQVASATHQHGGNVRIIARWNKPLHKIAEPDAKKRIEPSTGKLHPFANSEKSGRYELPAGPDYKIKVHIVEQTNEYRVKGKVCTAKEHLCVY